MRGHTEFLNVTGPEDLKDKDYRRRVHTQAMRAFRRRERMQHVQRFHQAASHDSEQAVRTEDGNAARRLDNDKRDWALHTTDGKDSGVPMSMQIGASYVDPFNSTALPLRNHQQTLIKHFADDIGTIMDCLNPHLSDVPWTHIWLREAISCRLLFLATCSHASEHMDAVYERRASRLSLQLREAILSTLRETLDNCGTSSNDAILATLVMLSGNALISGDIVELQMHNRALNKVLASRGGLSKSGYQGVLRAGALWGNASTAILVQLDTIETPDDQASRTEVDLIDKPRCSRVVGELLQLCRSMSAHLSAQKTSGPLHPLDCVEERSYIEFGFIRLWKALAKHHRLSPAWVQLARCASLSGLLFAFCHLRGLTAVSAVARKITANILLIMKSMSFSELAHSLSEDDRRILDWSHAVAVVMSADNEQRTQLRDLVYPSSNDVHLRQIKQFIKNLHTIAWPTEWTAVLMATILEVQTTR